MKVLLTSKIPKKVAPVISVADFMYQCYKKSMAVPSMKYTFEPNESPLVVFSTEVTVMVPYYKQGALLTSFVAEVDAVALEIAAVICAALPIPGARAAALALEAASMVFTGISVAAYYVAQDPDPNIGEIAELVDFNLPYNLQSLPEGNAKRLGLVALELALLEQAFAESCIRYDYAKAADNNEPNEAGMALQLGAALRYNSMALRKMQEFDLLIGIIIEEFGLPNPTDANIAEVWNDINENGLSESQKEILEILDFNEPNGPGEPYRPGAGDVKSLILAATKPGDPNIEPLRELWRDVENTLGMYSHSLVQMHYMMDYGLLADAEDQNLAESIEVQYANDVSITNVWASSGIVSVGGSVSINVEVENHGSGVDTFDVNAFGDDVNIGTIVGVSLAPGENRTLEFTWDTTSVSVGYYRIRAEAVDPNDNFSTDNIYNGRTIKLFDPFDTFAPAAPEGLHSTGQTNNSISLGWDLPLEADVVGYMIYQDGEHIGWAAKNYFTDTGLVPCLFYSYTVRAYDIAGNQSEPSEEVLETPCL